MSKIKTCKGIERTIEWIRNNPYTEKIIHVSEVELLSNNERVFYSEIQGAYPVDIEFTAHQKVVVTYLNTYFGVCKATILGGFDACRYKKEATSMYNGEHLGEYLIGVEFLGEWAMIVDTQRTVE